MGKCKPIYQGLFWALTDQAKEHLTELLQEGMDYDVAFVVLDELVREGVLKESDLYSIPEVPHETQRTPI